MNNMIGIYNINNRISYIKYCLVAFTILFGLTGLSLVIIGSTINAVFVEYSYFLENKYFAPAVFLYSVGFAVFIISTIGIVGALKENPCMISAYGILLGMVFMLQLAAGLSTNILTPDSTDQMRKKIMFGMINYNSNSTDESRSQIDVLQQGVGCCGINEPKDWKNLSNTGIPVSCCAKLLTNGTCVHIFNRGCFTTLEFIIDDVTNILAITAYVLAMMQLGGTFFALYLGKLLRTQKIAKDYRMWRLSNQLFQFAEKDNNYLVDKK